MAYLVRITPRAQRDLVAIYRAKNAEQSDAALKWYRGLRDSIFSLEEQPNRCPETTESSKLRHLLYGNKPYIYRIIYRIVEKQKTVDILHIRYGARKKFN